MSDFSIGKMTNLSAENMSLYYNHKPIIQHLSFYVNEGSILSVMGPNGAGKTTLLHTLAGLHKDFSGVFGFRKNNVIQPIPLKKIGYLTQKSHIDRQFPMTVAQILALSCSDSDKIRETLRIIHLDAKEPLFRLSGGQFQRLLFARLLLHDTPLILLDEPFAGLDESSIENFLHIIFGWQKQNKIIVLAHHNRERALRYFPNTLLLGYQSYHWGPTQEILDDTHWMRTHERTHMDDCC